MEKNWFLITGKSPQLSFSELKSQKDLFNYGSLSRVSEHCLEIKCDAAPDEYLNKLGGFTKAGKVIAHVKGRYEEAICDYLLKKNQSRSDFGLSFYDSDLGTRDAIRVSLDIKKILKKSGKPVRAFTPNKGSALPSVIVDKQLLQKGGTEIVVVKTDIGWTIGETTWVHQFEDWSSREYGKDAVDKKRGMIPHKLARIMLNLTGDDLTAFTTIYDPFCGTGVILLEAQELGCKVLGSDLDPVAINQSQINLNFSPKDDRLWVADSRNTIIPKLEGKMLIVTEPYLGPLWIDNPDFRDVKDAVIELSRLYSDSLKNWRKQIPRGTIIVMVFPILFGHSTYDRVVDTLSILGYSTSAGPLLYERSDQKVRRNIVKLIAV
jgi:tRNA (guanine10-N2)-dimethyltransferase